MQPFARLLLTFSCALLLSAPAFANPTDEITRAVTVNGVATVSAAQPQQFVKAFTAVTLRVPPRSLPDYVIAASNLRPDLTANAVAVAIKAAARNCESKPELLRTLAERIVKAAIAANPNAAVAVAKAGASAAPNLRRCVVAAAIAAAPEAKNDIVEAAASNTPPFAYLSFSASDFGGFSYRGRATINPANFSEPVDDTTVISPEQPAAR
jgi:hypothetical protein